MKFNSLQKDHGFNHHDECENNSLMNTSSSCNNDHDIVNTATTTTSNAMKMAKNNNNNNYHKSCDTIDQQSGLNYYYSLHSILSFAAENRALSANNNNKSYKLHDKTKRNQNLLSSYKYNANYLAGLRHQRQLYLAIRFSMRKNHSSSSNSYKKGGKNMKFILVKNLPFIRNYYHHDDSIDDPLRKFLNDHLNLRNHCYTLFHNQTKKLLFIKDDSDLPTCILLNNLLESFKFDFKNYNFNLNIDDYRSMGKTFTNDNAVLSIQDQILVSYLNSFRTF